MRSVPLNTNNKLYRSFRSIGHSVVAYFHKISLIFILIFHFFFISKKRRHFTTFCGYVVLLYLLQNNKFLESQLRRVYCFVFALMRIPFCICHKTPINENFYYWFFFKYALLYIDKMTNCLIFRYLLYVIRTHGNCILNLSKK